MDFVTHLPCTLKKHDSIWAIMDRLTKTWRHVDLIEDSSMEVR